MSDFSFKRDFKNIRWKNTIGLNFLRSAIAGVVWFFIATFIHKMPGGDSWSMLFFPFVYLVVLLPFGLFASFLSSLGVPFAGLLTFFFALCVTVADPIMYILHRAIPRIVPVEKYKFLSLHLVIFVLNNPDIDASEYAVPKEIERSEVKKLLSSKMRPDEDAEVNFLKEEIIADEEIRNGNTTGVPPKLEISNSIFNFYDLRAGSTITDTFTISNVGGGALSGSIKTDKKWLRVSQNKIDRTLKKRDITFYINTSGLAFGFRDTGTIEIRSNAGIERVSVTISVEATMIASLRREINIPTIAGLGALGLAITVAVIGLLMILKDEKEAELVKLTTKQEQKDRQAKYAELPSQQKTSAPVQSISTQTESGLPSLPYHELPLPQKYVEDKANIVSENIEKSLNVYLKEIEQKTAAQMIVLTINTTGDIPIETYARELAAKWKLGQKDKDNGVLVVIAKDDRAYRIEIGRGLEKILPDSFCGTVGKTYFVPEFQKGQFGEGIHKGVVAIGNKIVEDLEISTVSPSSHSETEKSASQEAGNNCFASVSPYRWKGEYYNNKDLSGSPSMVRDGGSDFINFAWGDFSPGQYCGISKDNFSVRWTRTVNFRSGTYRFMIMIRDARFYIDDILKLEENYIEPRTYTVEVPLTEGNHTIRMECCESSVGGVAKLSWQLVPMPEQSTGQPSVAINISGEWDGKVDDKKSSLKITQDGNSLSGNIVYGNVTEFLSGEINNDTIVLKGTGYTAKGVTGFSLDTFQGMISKDVNSINGNYTDEDGHSGTWFAKRKTTILTQESTANQNKKQQPQNSTEPQTTVPLQVKLTEALRKRPFIVIKRQTGRMNFDETSTDAKMALLDNGVISVSTEVGSYMNLNFSWSSQKSAYTGTWSDSRNNNIRGQIILWPKYDEEGNIKCFAGYMGHGNGTPNTVIKVKNMFCLCPDPD